MTLETHAEHEDVFYWCCAVLSNLSRDKGLANIVGLAGTENICSKHMKNFEQTSRAYQAAIELIRRLPSKAPENKMTS